MSRIVRYNPYWLWHTLDVLEPFSEEPFAPFWRPFTLAPWRSLLEEPFGEASMEMDLYETDDHLVIETALPGVKPEEIDIREENGFLTIRARSQEQEARRGNGWRWEQRRYGAWQRTIHLPEEVHAEKAKAELRDGVLTITLPKAQGGKKGKRIRVNAPRLSLPKLGSKNKRIKVK